MLIYVLRQRKPYPGGLDGYVFQGKAHADEWMAQKYIQGSGYYVEERLMHMPSPARVKAAEFALRIAALFRRVADGLTPPVRR